ncbi:MAG: N-6 DNA methylase, partial [Candidatus Hodarchaeales archaeon]
FYETMKEMRKKGVDEVVWGNFAGNDFFIPAKARWKRMKRLSTRVGTTLNKMVRLIEENNPFLQDVLSAIDFNIKIRRGDEILAKIISHLSLYSLGNKNFSDPRILAECYEHLIEKMYLVGPDTSRSVLQENVEKLLVLLARPKKGDWVCDPNVSIGNLLVSYAKYGCVDSEEVYFYGQEGDPVNWAICKMNLLMHGISNAQIEQGDVLREPKLMKSDKLLTFDVIISNPSAIVTDNWQEVVKEDRFGRFRFGVPSDHYGIFLVVQHMLSTLQSDGRMAVVLHPSFLFQGGKEKQIRRKLIENDLIEAIIRLPEVEGKVIVLFKKSKIYPRKTLFIDASRDSLNDQTIQRIIDSYHNFQESNHFSRIIAFKEIIQYSYNLNIPLYIDTPEPEQEFDPFMLKSNLLHLEMQREAVGLQLQNSLNKFEECKEFEAGELPSTWFTIQLGEIVILELGSNFTKLSKLGSIAVITVKDITKSGLISWDKLNFATTDDLNSVTIQINDILISRKGRATGKAVLVRELPYKNVRVSSDFFIIRTNNAEMIDQKYLYYVVSSTLVQKQIKKRFIGESGIDEDDFKTISVPIPPLHEQNALVEIFDTVDSSIVLTSNIISESRKLRQALLQKLISGRIQLN